MQQNFDQAIEGILGTAAKPEKNPEQDLTPENIHYEGDSDSIEPDHGDLKVTPEIRDNYIGAEIMTPRGGVLSRGQVTRQKRDSDGDPVGSSILILCSTHNPTSWSSMTMTRRN